jgi:hypothetical protein
MNDSLVTLGLEVLACLFWIDVKDKIILSLSKVLFVAIFIATSFQFYLYFTEILDPFFLIAFVVHTSLLIIAGLIVFFLKLFLRKYNEHG